MGLFTMLHCRTTIPRALADIENIGDPANAGRDAVANQGFRTAIVFVVFHETSTVKFIE